MAFPALKKCLRWFRKLRKARSGYEMIPEQSVTNNQDQAQREETRPKEASLLDMPSEIREKILHHYIHGNVVGIADPTHRYTNGVFFSPGHPSTVQISDPTTFRVQTPTLVNQDMTLVQDRLQPLDKTFEWALLRVCRQLNQELMPMIFDDILYSFSSARVLFRSVRGADVGTTLPGGARPEIKAYHFQNLKKLQVRVAPPFRTNYTITGNPDMRLGKTLVKYTPMLEHLIIDVPIDDAIQDNGNGRPWPRPWIMEMHLQIRGVTLPVAVLTFGRNPKKLKDLKKVSLLDSANVPSWGSNSETVLEAYENVIKRYFQDEIKADDYFAHHATKQIGRIKQKDIPIRRTHEEMRTIIIDGVLEYLENVPTAAVLRTRLATLRINYVREEGECFWVDADN